jgi:endonuclease YncB( thermonuclease family)
MSAHIVTRSVLASALGLIASSASAQAISPAAPTFYIPTSGVSFVTGDTWQQNGQTMRLYGVQSCIRGTSFTNQAGIKTDCGEASLAYLAALVKDTRPECAPIAQMGEPPSIVVVCTARVGGKELDLGMVLVTQGFAFTAFSTERKPVYLPYMIAELQAKKARAGLWAAADLPHPNDVIFGTLSGPAAKQQR